MLPLKSVCGRTRLSGNPAFLGKNGGRAVNDPSARNVAQAIVWGVTRDSPDGPVVMHAFGHAYSDIEIAALANYVTARFGAAPSSAMVAEGAQLRREYTQ